MEIFGAIILMLVLVGIIIAVRKYMKIPLVTLFKETVPFKVLEEGHHFRKNVANSIDFTGVTDIGLSPNVSAYIALREEGKIHCPKIVAITNNQADDKVIPLSALLQDEKYDGHVISSINVVRNN